MAASASNTDFIVWGVDQTPYGPVELRALVSSVKDQRFTSDTWIFVEKNASWQKAGEVPELQMFFRSKSNGASTDAEVSASPRGIDARALRRIKILAGMSDAQLERFAEFVEVEKFPQWSVIVKQGAA